MKKVIAMVIAMSMMSVFLMGCYSHTCEQPAPQPMNMKGEG